MVAILIAFNNPESLQYRYAETSNIQQLLLCSTTYSALDRIPLAPLLFILDMAYDI